MAPYISWSILWKTLRSPACNKEPGAYETSGQLLPSSGVVCHHIMVARLYMLGFPSAHHPFIVCLP